MSPDDLEQAIEEGKEAYENCDCNGSPSKPWLYCDDCQEYRELLEQSLGD